MSDTQAPHRSYKVLRTLPHTAIVRVRVGRNVGRYTVTHRDGFVYWAKEGGGVHRVYVGGTKTSCVRVVEGKVTGWCEAGRNCKHCLLTQRLIQSNQLDIGF